IRAARRSAESGPFSTLLGRSSCSKFSLDSPGWLQPGSGARVPHGFGPPYFGYLPLDSSLRGLRHRSSNSLRGIREALHTRDSDTANLLPHANPLCWQTGAFPKDPSLTASSTRTTATPGAIDRLAAKHTNPCLLSIWNYERSIHVLSQRHQL